MRATTILGVVLAAAWIVPRTEAQEFPTHSVRVVVPLPPGATADTLPRLVAQKLQAKWGQTVLVENRPGAAQNLGAEIVARAPPDGYTLLATPQGPLTISQSLFPKLAFNPEDFTPITIMASLPYVLVTAPSSDVHDLKEFLSRAREAREPLSYASPGVGSPNHLSMEWLSSLAHVKLTHVPYLGASPALLDVLGGRVTAMFDNAGNVLSFIRDGKLRALAVSSKTRMPELPDTPSIAELYPDFVATSWFAFVAPPATPKPLANRLNRDIVEAMRSPEAESLVRQVAGTVIAGSPEATALTFGAEAVQWRRVIAAAGVRVGEH